MEKRYSKHTYTAKYHNLNAPQEIVPYLIGKFHPKSVVDVGCGVGTFLHVFLKNDVKDILGIDGGWVDKSALFFPEDFFVEKDLEKKLDINRKFDLVLCLEVAEHLSEKSADILIINLTNLSDIIIFSAATVHQGGQNHINEQHFDYWIEKFSKRGFIFYDIFRSRFWNNEKINWWYKQNMFLVVHDSVDVSNYGIDPSGPQRILEYIHPDLLALHAGEAQKFKNKVNWIQHGKAPVSYYFQLLRKKIGSKFLPSA
jgi:SAM-dependent methyltransferase